MVAYGNPSSQILRELISTLEQSADASHRLYPNAAGLAKDFPGLRPRPDHTGVYDAEAGVIKADKALTAVRVLCSSLSST